VQYLEYFEGKEGDDFSDMAITKGYSFQKYVSAEEGTSWILVRRDLEVKTFKMLLFL
jgi:hypothetical protein